MHIDFLMLFTKVVAHFHTKIGKHKLQISASLRSDARYFDALTHNLYLCAYSVLQNTLKHRHARRARVIFCERKGFGDSRIKSMTCKMFYLTNYSNLTRLQININISLFCNRQFDSLFDTTHTVIGLTCAHT